jgi:tetratricopeptide (TPR) repeat protein
MNITTTTKLIEAYLERGTAHAKQNQWERAISCYQEITQIDPKNATAFHHWADALLNLERWEEAIAIYQRAIAINPNFDWSHYNLGDALVRLERWEEAIAAYQKAFALNPNLPSISQKLGNAFLERSLANRKEMFVLHRQALQDNPQDIDRYHRAIELQPCNAELYLGLGNALIANHKLDEAIVAYQMALQLKPDYADAQLQLDKILECEERETSTEDSRRSKRHEKYQPNIETTKEDKVSQGIKLKQAKQILDNLNQITLDNFFLTNAYIDLPRVEQPQVSIILILYNRSGEHLNFVRTKELMVSKACH